MAIVHFRAQLIGVARSAVAAAAYRHRTSMFDQTLDRVWSYKPDPTLVHAAIARPLASPAWLKDIVSHRSVEQASAGLWNAASAAEKRFDGQVAREFVIALPIELTRAQNIALMQNYVSEFTERGFVVDWVFHDKPGNPHVHLMHTMRPLTVEGFGPKVTPIRSASGEPLRTSAGKIAYSRFAGGPEDFKALRHAWVDYANVALAQAGYDTRLDARSFAEQGLAIPASRHLGPALAALQRRGVDSLALEAFAADDMARDAAVKADPTVVIDIVSSQKATFTEVDIARALHVLTITEETFADVMPKVLADPRLVQLVRQEVEPISGVAHNKAVYATRPQMVLEEQLAADAVTLASARITAPTANVIARCIAQTEASMGMRVRLADEQKAGVAFVTGPERIAVIVGLAGTGKSTLLSSANAAWVESGMRVHGAALSGIATRGLQSSSGIQARTVSSWLRGWERGRDRLRTGDVFVLDEAGMLGTADMHTIVRHVTDTGAKLVLAGDPAQLQPIAAGAPLRAMIETVGFHELSGIIRQRDLSMRSATAHFARGRMTEGLAYYKRIGAMTTVETTDQAIHELVLGYLAAYDPSAGTQIALAYTNAAVDRINGNIRSALQHTGRLSQDYSFETADGIRMFSAGDRVLFNETKRVVLASGRAIQLDRGALATVVSAANNHVTLVLDSGTSITLTPDVYNALTHGYAATFHKSQGVTVDRTFVLVTPNIDRHMAYVGFSRHRDTLQVYAGQNAFKDMSIEAALARAAPQVNALDDVARYLERRGIDTTASIAHRMKCGLLAARHRLSVAWDVLCARSVALAQRHRAFAMPPANDVTHALADAGLLHKYATGGTELMQLMIANNLTPAEIADVMTPPGTATNLSSLRSSITKAAETLYLEGRVSGIIAKTRVAVGTALPPPPSNTYRSQASFLGTTISVAFSKDRDAAAIMTAAGYRFNREAEAFTREIKPADRTRELAVLLRARFEINTILANKDKAHAHAIEVAMALRREIDELGISAKEARIAVADPKASACRDALMSAGGREVQTKSGAYYAFTAPGTGGGISELLSKLRRIERLVPAATRGPAQVLPSPVGYRLTADGMMLTIETAQLPQTRAILERIQARRTPSGALEVRMDIQDPLVVKETLKKLHAYHQSILIPPHSPSSGIDLPQSTVEAVLALTADQLLHDRGRAIAGPVKRMIEAHVKSLKNSRIAPDLEAASVLATVARHIEGMHRVLAPGHGSVAHEASFSR